MENESFPRDTRCQGIVVQQGRLLLLKQRWKADARDYWVVPGGAREPGETDEQCVTREIKEETNLTVRVIQLLFEEDGAASGVYRRLKTFLCEPESSSASPGREPEDGGADSGSITGIQWLSVSDDSSWAPDLSTDPFTYTVLQKARRMLGYLA